MVSLYPLRSLPALLTPSSGSPADKIALLNPLPGPEIELIFEVFFAVHSLDFTGGCNAFWGCNAFEVNFSIYARIGKVMSRSVTEAKSVTPSRSYNFNLVRLSFIKISG